MRAGVCIGRLLLGLVATTVMALELHDTGQAAPAALDKRASIADSMHDETTATTPDSYSTKLTRRRTRILISGPGSVMLATVRASGIGLDIPLNHTLPGNPSWVAFSAPDRLFAVDEYGESMRSLAVDLDALRIRERQVVSASPGVVHLALTAGGTRMLGASYGSGVVDVWDVADADAVRRLPSVPLPTDHLGPVAGRQDRSRPHQVVPYDDEGRLVVVPDLGTDSIHVLAARRDGAGYELVNTVRVEPAGCGPRHGAFWPPRGYRNPRRGATHFIVVCELANLVIVYAVDVVKSAAAKGGLGLSLTRIDAVSSLGPGRVDATAAAGELILAGERDVYVSNRLTSNGEDNVAHFRLFSGRQYNDEDYYGEANGEAAKGYNGGDAKKKHLIFQSIQLTRGLSPRMMSLAAEQSILLVANDGARGVGVAGFERDARTGVLRPLARLDLPRGQFAASSPQFVQQIR